MEFLEMESIKEIAQAIRNNCLANYDFDITEKRCHKTGRLTGNLSDSEIYNLYQISDLDLIKTCERLEKIFLFNQPCLADWLYTDTESLDYHRNNSQRDFMFYSIRKLMETSTEYLAYKSKDNFKLTQEGQFLFDCDFLRFVKQFDNKEFSIESMNKINDKLILLLSLVGLATVEKLNNYSLSSFDKIADLINKNQLVESLENVVSDLIIKFKLKYAISNYQELTANDIELIRQAHRKKQLDEYAEKANACKVYRELKRCKDTTNFLRNILGELYVTQQNSFKRELEARKGLPLAEKINKGLIKVNSNGKLENVTETAKLSQLTKISLTAKIIIK